MNGSDSNVCILKHVIWSRATVECGSFQANITEQLPPNCFKSAIRATASLLLDGVEVECKFVHGTTNLTAGRERIAIIGEQLIIIRCRDDSAKNYRN